MIRWKQAVDHFADFGLTFGNPDFALYAQSYGARGHRIETIESFVPTLDAAFRGGGLHLISIPIDYSGNVPGLVDNCRARANPGEGFGRSSNPERHCERSEAIQNLSAETVWIASLCSQ